MFGSASLRRASTTECKSLPFGLNGKVDVGRGPTIGGGDRSVVKVLTRDRTPKRRVEVDVGVDQSGEDVLTRSVDDPIGLGHRRRTPDGNDTTFVNRDIGLSNAVGVDHTTAANDQINVLRLETGMQGGDQGWGRRDKIGGDS